ncbi:hypothetical protein EDC04DRAFT_2607751 [Pisolithus marmoratus]|nr:hypothetical protein EDC04DRAFT_2607751 [Pisolithus marmoratus]
MSPITRGMACKGIRHYVLYNLRSHGPDQTLLDLSTLPSTPRTPVHPHNTIRAHTGVPAPPVHAVEGNPLANANEFIYPDARKAIQDGVPPEDVGFGIKLRFIQDCFELGNAVNEEQKKILRALEAGDPVSQERLDMFGWGALDYVEQCAEIAMQAMASEIKECHVACPWHSINFQYLTCNWVTVMMSTRRYRCNHLSEPYPEGSGPETGVGANSEKPQEERGNSGVLYTRENVLRQCPGNETPEGSCTGVSDNPKVRRLDQKVYVTTEVRSQEFQEFPEFYRKGSSTNEGKLSEKEGILKWRSKFRCVVLQFGNQSLSFNGTDEADGQEVSVISAMTADAPSHVPTARVPAWCAMSALPYQKMSFKCPACHEKEEHAAHSKPMPYFTVQGNSVPACNEPTFISGVCERASKSQVCGGPILIIHFIYMGLNARGGVPRVLNTVLEEYHSEKTLCYLEVVFDFGTHRKLGLWRSEAESFAATISEDIFQQKIFFISVHSKVMRGDLFAGKGEDGSDVAVRPEDFMNYLFSGGLQPLVNGATIFMLSCGPLVAFSESVCSLKKALLKLRPTYTVAFGAKRFISAVVKSFIVAFGVRVVIQGHNLGEVFKDLLDASIELPMHTDAYIFQVKDQMAAGAPSNAIHVSGTRYTWFHSHRRPWGNPLPMSCPNCSSIHSWSPSKSGRDQSGAPGCISTCRSPTCGFTSFSYQPQTPYEIMKSKAKDNEAKGWIKQTGI